MLHTEQIGSVKQMKSFNDLLGLLPEAESKP